MTLEALSSVAHELCIEFHHTQCICNAPSSTEWTIGLTHHCAHRS